MIFGIKRFPLKVNPDRRGSLTEIFRECWVPELKPKQVNIMPSHAGVIRGSHVHRFHSDYFVLVAGRAFLGLRDVRTYSPTAGFVSLIEMFGHAPEGIVVPEGVIHGVHFVEESVLATVESEYYDPAEEIRVRWNDPALGIPWAADKVYLSDADGDAPSYAELVKTIEPWQNEWQGKMENIK